MPRTLKPGIAPYIVFGVMFSFPLACIAYVTLRTGQFGDCAKMAGLVLVAYLLVCFFISRSRVVVTPDYVAVRSVFGSEQRMDFRNVVASFAIPNRHRAAYLEMYSEPPDNDVTPAFVLSLKTLRHSDIAWLLTLPQLKLEI